jgi:hypothetical protein
MVSGGDGATVIFIRRRRLTARPVKSLQECFSTIDFSEN